MIQVIVEITGGRQVFRGEAMSPSVADAVLDAANAIVKYYIRGSSNATATMTVISRP